MKKCVFRILAAGLLFLSLAGAAQAQVVDRIVAVVNGEIITLQELKQQVLALAGPAPAEADKVAAQILDEMIDDIILRQEAERLKVEVSDSEVENEIRQVKARRRLSDAEFERALSMQGMTAAQYKERTRHEIVKHKMLGYMVRRKVVVTQEEIDAYYEKNRAELTTEREVDFQILVVGEQDRAESLRDSIVSGELSFADAVDKYTIGPKENDGVMKGVNWRELDVPWREALRDVNAGDISKPFVIQDRWVVVKMLERRDGVRQENSTVDDEVREAIMRPKLEERFKEYMNGLRAKAVIEKRL